jgi:hypothetical protein
MVMPVELSCLVEIFRNKDVIRKQKCYGSRFSCGASESVCACAREFEISEALRFADSYDSDALTKFLV